MNNLEHGQLMYKQDVHLSLEDVPISPELLRTVPETTQVRRGNAPVTQRLPDSNPSGRTRHRSRTSTPCAPTHLQIAPAQPPKHRLEPTSPDLIRKDHKEKRPQTVAHSMQAQQRLQPHQRSSVRGDVRTEVPPSQPGQSKNAYYSEPLLSIFTNSSTSGDPPSSSRGETVCLTVSPSHPGV
jgi:hypothetical protein